MKKTTKKRSLNLKSFIINTLRRATYRWPPKGNVHKAARVDRGKYKCAICGNIFGRKEVNVDHINPVVDPEKGFTTWDDYINRMFCDESGLQVICFLCHDLKTEKEQGTRKKRRKRNEPKGRKHRTKVEDTTTGNNN